MRFNYYIDYSKRISFAKRVYSFLIQNNQNNQAKFDFFQCCKGLRRTPYQRILNNSQQRSIRHDLADEIAYSLKILSNIGAIESYSFEKKVDSYEYTAIINELDGIERLIEYSDYFPLKGSPQKITKEFTKKKVEEYDIQNYQEILIECKKGNYNDTVISFRKQVFPLWEDSYERMKGSASEINTVTKHNFQFLIDMGYDILDKNGKVLEYQNERTVIFAGYSKSESSNRIRNSNRLAGYRKRHIEEWTDKETDTGHYIAHSIWGITDKDNMEVDLEFNLFPQKRSLNQGHSKEGKLYRQMEHYCAVTPNVFLFARPIYGDSSDRPYILEYGILKPDLTLWIEQFVNI